MKKILLVALLMQSALLGAQVKVDHLTTENLVDPIGITVQPPRFSWMLHADRRNIIQAAYEIRVSTSFGNKGDLWSTGKVTSDQSTFVAYAGKPLTSGSRYFWQVRVWDETGKPSAWSAPANFRMGLLQPSDWHAKWITSGVPETADQRPSPLFRKTFVAKKTVVSAIAYATSKGLYEGFLNGARIGDAYLTPGWTSYNKRLQYQMYDLTGLVKEGPNAIGFMLGNGWYRGFIGWENQNNFYGKTLALLFQLDIVYSDGTRERIVTDESWKSSTGSILYSEIYHGETIDARRDQPGWATTAFSDPSWAPVVVSGEPVQNVIATYNEPIRKHETFKVVKKITTPKGEQVFDFGQILTGWVKVKVKGQAGDKITLTHAEVLDKAGNFYTENLRPARQKNQFILRGGSDEVFEPHFTFMGFRYVKVEDYPGTLAPEDLEAVTLYSDVRPAGTFISSSPLLNQLQHNIQWSQRGNFLDVPTDCPQRDERLGWTGDAQAFCRTAAFNYDVHNFFMKWLKDLEADQIDGSVPFVIPHVLSSRDHGSAGWGDAATIVPWNLYLAYGDTKVLSDQFESMKAWVDWIGRQSTNNLWNKGFHFGDWLFYRPFDDNDGRSAVTDKYLIAQCFYAHSLDLVVRTAKILGRQDEVARYADLQAKVRDAFVREYVTPNGKLVSGTQTAYVLALQFDMLPEAWRAPTAKLLAENVKSYDNHLTTGFLGTPYLCHVLSRFGYGDVAYTLLMQETYPSWLYPVKMGATTIWERWDGQKPDGTFQTPTMNSFNHYAYGAIGDWMYRAVVGLDTDETAPGYKGIVIRPLLGKALTQASANLTTPYGKVSAGWRTAGERVTLDVEIPANTRATVYVPSNGASLSLDGKPAAATAYKMEGAFAVFHLGSGTYRLESNY